MDMSKTVLESPRALSSVTSQLMKLSQLSPNKGQIEGLPANPRLIRDEKFNKLKKSIEEDPEMLNLREIIAYDNGDNKPVIIMGNMRYRAMLDLGMKEAPVKVLHNDTPIEKLKAYTMRDNVSYGEWDWDMLANEWDLSELGDWGMDVPSELMVSDEDFGDGFTLPDGDKSDSEKMTFTLSSYQAEFVKECLKMVKLPQENNGENKNGLALFILVKQWDEQRK